MKEKINLFTNIVLGQTITIKNKSYKVLWKISYTGTWYEYIGYDRETESWTLTSIDWVIEETRTKKLFYFAESLSQWGRNEKEYELELTDASWTKDISVHAISDEEIIRTGTDGKRHTHKSSCKDVVVVSATEWNVLDSAVWDHFETYYITRWVKTWSYALDVEDGECFSYFSEKISPLSCDFVDKKKIRSSKSSIEWWIYAILFGGYLLFILIAELSWWHCSQRTSQTDDRSWVRSESVSQYENDGWYCRHIRTRNSSNGSSSRGK